MAMVTIKADRCTSCHAVFDGHLLGVCSGIGPPVGRCLRCGKATETGRAEWAALGTRGRLQFAIVTIVYVALVGCIGANFLFGIHLMRQGKYPESNPFHFDDPLFVQFIVACGLATLLLQGLRVALSVRRAAANSREQPVASMFAPDLNFGMHIKVLAVLCIVYFGAKAIWG